MGHTTSGTPKLKAIAALVFLVVAGASAEVKCGSIYKGFSECVLELGEGMATYQEEENSENGVQIVCGHWEAFHTCATTALSECQEDVSRIWERLKEDSKKIRFQGSLFDLCAPSAAPSLLPRSRSPPPLLLLLLLLGSLAWLPL
ncbi:neuritin-like [Conger conger]|uniref:neuritin-like n=1 Tax=Conger conger TaxID=82655 RepID=UPI002A5A7866|nr:neuritin-like [Conger conger]